MKNRAVIVACFLFITALSLNTLHAYDTPALFTSPTPTLTTPTPQGVPTVTIAPTVATAVPTLAPTVEAAPVATFPPTVTALPASGEHADWRPMMALAALLFLAVSGWSLWYLRIRSKTEG